MQFRKFEATDMREALAAIKLELGPDAMIVATRSLDAGLFRRPRLEVTAAYEETLPQRPNDAQSQATALQSDTLEVKLDPLRRELRALRSSLRSNDTDRANEALRSEIGALREALASLPLGGLPAPAHDPLLEVLQAADLEPDLATELAAAAVRRAQMTTGGGAGIRDLLVALEHVLAAQLSVDDRFFTDGQSKRVAFIGPTGVGKTTTIAKVAAHAALMHHKSVALISLDTYRVAASEQLRYYANLIDVPMVVARDAAQFSAAMQAHSHADVILVDTAGRSITDKSHHAQLSELFVAHRVQPYLAVAAATRRTELRLVLRAFAALDPQALVITKLDEALALGAVVNCSRRCRVPMTFVTTGQRVPEDLALPNAAQLATRLVHSVVDRTRMPRTPSHTPDNPSESTL